MNQSVKRSLKTEQVGCARAPVDIVRWFTSKEAAEYLRTTVGSIHNMVYRGQLECFRRLGRLLFRKVDLDRLIIGAS